MKYKIHVIENDGELLNTIIIDTNELNWDSNLSTNMLGAEIIDEIKRAQKRKAKEVRKS